MLDWILKPTEIIGQLPKIETGTFFKICFEFLASIKNILPNEIIPLMVAFIAVFVAVSVLKFISNCIPL